MTEKGVGQSLPFGGNLSTNTKNKQKAKREKQKNHSKHETMEGVHLGLSGLAFKLISKLMLLRGESLYVGE